jgi:HK97 gp10 family phage protein
MAKQVNISGVSEVNELLKQLPDKLSQKAIENSMAAGARVIRNEAQRLVPVESGTLRDSITVARRAKVGDAKTRIRGTVYIGIKGAGRFYAHLVEFGHSGAPAHPFLRPAVDNKHEAALQVIGPKLGKEVEKQARKLSGRLTGRQIRRFAR